MQRIVITGASGFIGRHLCSDLARDYEVFALSRDARRARTVLGGNVRIYEWDTRTIGAWGHIVDDAYAVVNLAGDNIAEGRWNFAKKQDIRRSRIDVSRTMLEAVQLAKHKPHVFIQSSAVGYYGSGGERILTEDDPPGESFLADVCQRWESFAYSIRNMGIRTLIIRTAAVIGPGGGMLEKLLPVFRMGLGGWLGSGNRWLSWISIDDQVAAIRFLIEKETADGPYNLTSPEPVTMRTFCQHLAKILKKPCLVRGPAFVAKLMFGQMADEVILASQRAHPKRLVDEGFEFKYPNLDWILQAAIR